MDEELTLREKVRARLEAARTQLVRAEERNQRAKQALDQSIFDCARWGGVVAELQEIEKLLPVEPTEPKPE